LKRSVLEKFKFDEDFKSYGWEDIELGYRLEKNLGFKLFFEPKIKVFHHHLIDESSMKSRMKSIGSAAHIIDRKHPELGKVPNLFKSCVFDVLGSFLVVGVLSLLALVSKRFLYLKYYALSKRYFMQGVRESF
jgi:GT2 family glycosyltransferase